MQTWKISHRLMAGFGLVVLALLGMSVFSVLTARGIDGALTANATQNAVIQRAAINFRGSAHDRSIAVRDVVLAPTEEARKKEVEAIARLADFYAKSAAQLDDVLKSASQVPPEVGPMVQSLKDIEARTVATTAKVVALMQAGDRAGAEALLWAEAKPQYEQWLAAANKLIDYEEARIIANSQLANKDASQFTGVMLSITLLAVLISIAVTVLVSRSISRELGAEPNEVRSVVQAIQQGDLTVPVQVKAGDTTSVMVAVRDMQQRFHELVSAVRDNVDQLRTTSHDISTGNQNLGQRTEQAASSLEQTAASMEELTATVRQSADSARQANQLATTAAGTATKGGGGHAAGGEHHAGHSPKQPEDCRHHRRDRWHRVPDQHSRVERSGGGCACWRTRAGLCSGGDGGAQPRAAQRRSCQGDQVAHPDQRGEGRFWRRTGEQCWRDDERNRAGCSACERHHRRNQQCGG